MYQEIKKMADDALALQNKDGMDSTLREISVLCGQLHDAELLASDPAGLRPMNAEKFEAAELAQFQAAKPKKAAKK